jgi:lysophospholipase
VTPRTAQGKRIRYAIHEYETLIDSSEVELADWIRIASDIENNYQQFDAFVVLHGTDSMCYQRGASSLC